MKFLINEIEISGRGLGLVFHFSFRKKISKDLSMLRYIFNNKYSNRNRELHKVKNRRTFVKIMLNWAK